MTTRIRQSWLYPTLWRVQYKAGFFSRWKTVEAHRSWYATDPSKVRWRTDTGPLTFFDRLSAKRASRKLRTLQQVQQMRLPMDGSGFS